jgi:hypothetical protein
MTMISMRQIPLTTGHVQRVVLQASRSFKGQDVQADGSAAGGAVCTDSDSGCG